MFAEVVAIPTQGTAPASLGTCFELTEDAPLLIGRSAQCDLSVDAPLGRDLQVGLLRGVPHAWTERGLPVACSLNGRVLDQDLSYELGDGDHLVFQGGLVVALRDRPLVTARHVGLEAALAAQPDDRDALAVYSDFLSERGDPLVAWLSSDRREVEAERVRALGSLSESARTQAVRATFSDAGLVTTLRLARHAVVGAPGLFWHLEQLGALAVARTLTSLSIDYVVGTPAKQVLPPRGVRWPTVPQPQAVMEAVLEHLADACFAGTLRELSFGVGAAAMTVSAEAQARARARLPSWNPGALVETPQRATLEVVTEPEGMLVFPRLVGWFVRLGVDTRIGAGNHCQVFVRGRDVPPDLCRVLRRDEGWELLANDAVTLRVNGKRVKRTLLQVGDLVEPLPGLVFRFRVTLIDSATR